MKIREFIGELSAKETILQALGEISTGSITVYAPEGCYEFGNGNEICADIKVHDWQFAKLCILKSSIGLGEGYI